MCRHQSSRFRRLAGRVATVVLAALACAIPAFCSEINKAIEKGDLEKVKALLKADPDVRAKLTDKEIEANFDLGFHLKHVDTIFKRVFGES